MSAKKDQGHISSYTRKLRENVKAILENYGEMLKAAKVGLSFTERSKASTNVFCRYQKRSSRKPRRCKWLM